MVQLDIKLGALLLVLAFCLYLMHLTSDRASRQSDKST